MIDVYPQNLVLALYPFSRGFAFVFFEGPNSPYVWGIKGIRDKRKTTKAIDEIKKLIDQHRPAVLVIEDTACGELRRTARVRKLYRMIAHLAAAEYVDLYRCTNSEVRCCFASVGATTKFEIAQAIARQIPAFAHRMPPRRKPWAKEDPRQSLFDAIALALVFYRQVKSPYSDEVGKA